MLREVKKLIQRWGSAMTLQSQSRVYSIRAFLQHSNSKSWQNLEKDFSPLGEVPGGWYVYIGPADPAAEEGDTLQLGEKSYRFCRVETVMFRDEAIYCWGLCMEKGSDETWGLYS